MRVMVGLDLSVKTLLVVLTDICFLLATTGGYLAGRGDNWSGWALTGLAAIVVVLCHRLAIFQHRFLTYLLSQHAPEKEGTNNE